MGISTTRVFHAGHVTRWRDLLRVLCVVVIPIWLCCTWKHYFNMFYSNVYFIFSQHCMCLAWFWDHGQAFDELINVRIIINITHTHKLLYLFLFILVWLSCYFFVLFTFFNFPLSTTVWCLVLWRPQADFWWAYVRSSSNNSILKTACTFFSFFLFFICTAAALVCREKK